MSPLEQALQSALRNRRVCPQPRDWQRMYDMLPAKVRNGSGWEPSLPLILGAWWHSSDAEKASRLREHLEWAARHDAVTFAQKFLEALPETSWHHEGE